MKNNFDMLIDNQLVTGERYEVLNPSTLEVVGTAIEATLEDIDHAAQAASRAFLSWEKDMAFRRQKLNELADIIGRHADQIADLLVQEQGQPLSVNKSTVEYSGEVFRYHANLELNDEILSDDGSSLVKVLHRAIGVAGIILPWNVPVALFAQQVGAALLVGNTVVLKPAPTTPLATLYIAKLIQSCLPPGVLNIVTGEDAVGAAIVKHPLIRKISFTGSVAAGIDIATQAAPMLKRVTLELGGNDPAIVLDDVNLDQMAQSLFDAATPHTGQVCVAVKRIYAQEGIYQDLTDRLCEIARNTPVGDGFNARSVMGPLQNRQQHERAYSILEATKAQGGQILTGGTGLEGYAGYYMTPAIVKGAEDDWILVKEEQFSPIIPIMPFKTVDEALLRANNTEYGLGGSVWSSDEDRAAEIALEIQSGSVWVNQHRSMRMDVPFGGFKYSGIGRVRGVYGVDCFSEIQALNVKRVQSGVSRKAA